MRRVFVRKWPVACSFLFRVQWIPTEHVWTHSECVACFPFPCPVDTERNPCQHPLQTSCGFFLRTFRTIVRKVLNIFFQVYHCLHRDSDKPIREEKRAIACRQSLENECVACRNLRRSPLDAYGDMGGNGISQFWKSAGKKIT